MFPLLQYFIFIRIRRHFTDVCKVSLLVGFIYLRHIFIIPCHALCNLSAFRSRIIIRTIFCISPRSPDKQCCCNRRQRNDSMTNDSVPDITVCIFIKSVHGIIHFVQVIHVLFFRCFILHGMAVWALCLCFLNIRSAVITPYHLISLSFTRTVLPHIYRLLLSCL